MRLKELIFRFLYPKTLNIHSKWRYPACALSNFATYTFYLNEVQCNSMEGFLQSLKYQDMEKQKAVALLIGIETKKAGEVAKENDSFDGTTVYWKGKSINRFSDDYQTLI